MGTDDLFHRRKARQVESHRRKIARRAPYERLLIVCEGEKTEPHYLKGLRHALNLNPANVVIADKKRGLDPKCVVEYALEEFKKSGDFNHVYCVFDRDRHPTYDAALNKIRDFRLKGGAGLHAITSIPCFEIWLLLHFCYTSRPFQAGPDDSSCAPVVTELRKPGRIPRYEKGEQAIFSLLHARVETAVTNAERLLQACQSSGSDNPSTRMHELVIKLKSLRASRC
jgi:hypothetical protein